MVNPIILPSHTRESIVGYAPTGDYNGPRMIAASLQFLTMSGHRLALRFGLCLTHCFGDTAEGRWEVLRLRR